MLESELSRLRYRDPVKSCELPEEDIVFDETGNVYILYLYSLYDIKLAVMSMLSQCPLCVPVGTYLL